VSYSRMTARVLVVVVGLLLQGAATPATVHAGLHPGGLNGGPTKVYVQMGLMDVDAVNGADQSFIANLYLAIRWRDPSLAHDGPGDEVHPVDSIWNPQLLFVNQQRLWRSLPEVVHVKPDGTAIYRQRVWGSFSQPLEVREFPFDTHDFEVRIASHEYTPDEVVFLENPDRLSGLADAFSLPDWKILSWELNLDPYKPAKWGRELSSFAIVFRAQRHSANYVVKVILPLILIVLMSSIVFWIDPSQASSQIGIATTSMLTLIAYRFMVSGTIPPVPYLTRIDYFILGSTMLVFCALIQAVATSILFSRERALLARRIDVWCRVIFSVAALLIGYISLVA
jgi:hypothetical protein